MTRYGGKLWNSRTLFRPKDSRQAMAIQERSGMDLGGHAVRTCPFQYARRDDAATFFVLEWSSPGGRVTTYVDVFLLSDLGATDVKWYIEVGSLGDEVSRTHLPEAILASSIK